ncbi:hypothetical protein ACB098_04G042800 [Castanea mollissima]
MATPMVMALVLRLLSLLSLSTLSSLLLMLRETLETLTSLHHHNGRWEARIGRVCGNKYLYLGTYIVLY